MPESIPVRSTQDITLREYLEARITDLSAKLDLLNKTGWKAIEIHHTHIEKRLEELNGLKQVLLDERAMFATIVRVDSLSEAIQTMINERAAVNATRIDRNEERLRDIETKAVTRELVDKQTESNNERMSRMEKVMYTGIGIAIGLNFIIGIVIGTIHLFEK